MYNYQNERSKLFTDEGQKTFLKIRDRCKRLLHIAGAFRANEATSEVSGDTWLHLACLDRMLELGEIVEMPRDCWAQYRVFTSPEVSNR